MPNWCKNRVTVLGEPGELQRFKKFVCNGEKSFNFGVIRPMPEALLHVRSPVQIVDTEEEAQKIIQEQEDNYLTSSYPITKETQAKFCQEYGADNWYDWRIQNWGVKWDCSDVILNEGTFGQYHELEYNFDTPWGPPQEIHTVLVDEFPNLRIIWFWDEPCVGGIGYL